MKPILLFLLLLAFAAQCMASGIQIKTTQVPNGIIKDAYYGVISVSGGCAPYSWQVVSGSLPSGVTMQPSSSTKTLTLSGTTKKAATYSFTVSAKGCGGRVAQASYKIVVQAAADHVIDLSWNASTSSEVVGYNVYRGPDGKSWSQINSGLAASTAFSDSSAADSSTYFYATTAVDVKGSESKKSNSVKTVVP